MVHVERKTWVVDVLVVVTKFVNKCKCTTVATRTKEQDCCILCWNVVAECALVFTCEVVTVFKQLVCFFVEIDFLVKSLTVDFAQIVGNNTSCKLIVKDGIFHQSFLVVISQSAKGCGTTALVLCKNISVQWSKILLTKSSHLFNVSWAVFSFVHVFISILNIVVVACKCGNLVVDANKFFVQIKNFIILVSVFDISELKQNFICTFVKSCIFFLSVGVGHCQSNLDILLGPTFFGAEEEFSILSFVNLAEQCVVVLYHFCTVIGNSIVLFFPLVIIIYAVEYVCILILLCNVINVV